MNPTNFRVTAASSFIGKLIRPCNEEVCTSVYGYTEKYPLGLTIRLY
jgi:hypothetical protein